MIEEKEKNELASETEDKKEEIFEETVSPENDEVLPDPEKEAEIAKIKAEAIAEYEAKKAAEAEALNKKKDEEKKSLRKTFSACGWSVLVLIGVWMGIILGFSAVIGFLEILSTSEFFNFQTSPQDFYMKYYLVINEVSLLVAVFIASLLLKTKNPVKPEKHSVSFGKFAILFPICFAISTIGNIISNAFTIFSSFFGGNATDELTEILSSTNVWLTFVCVGIIAPIIEEIFFRKMLIDRLRPHGEMVCLVVSSLFFALFHQNVGQLFYAFGIGLVLAHLYYHSGRCSLNIILHAIFNMIGTIPLFFYDTLLELEDVLYRILEEGESFMILSEFVLPIMLYLLYALVLFALSISGIIIICTNYKKIKIQKTQSALSPAEQRTVFWKTPGVIVSVIVTGILTIASLF